MSNLKKESSTPIKSSSNLYDNHQTNAKLINDSNSTHTPCTRLSRVAIDSQSNPPCKRIRTTHSQRPAMNFNDKLIQALGEEGISNPNLSMAFGGNRIRMTNKVITLSLLSNNEIKLIIATRGIKTIIAFLKINIAVMKMIYFLLVHT
jgi:hypothetical protein